MAAAGPRGRARRDRRAGPHGGLRMTTRTSRTHQPPEPEEVSLIAPPPGLARIGAVASIRLLEWSAGAYLRTTTRLVRAAANGEVAGEVLQRTGEDLVAYFRELLVATSDAAGPMDDAPPAPEEPVGESTV